VPGQKCPGTFARAFFPLLVQVRGRRERVEENRRNMKRLDFKNSHKKHTKASWILVEQANLPLVFS
jgi:hypothetical protein